MSSALWALALSLMGASASAGDAPPVRLMLEDQGSAVRLSVVGESESAFQGGYSLEVVSDAAAGGNRTVQRGTVSLRPGVPVTLMTLTLGNVGEGSWTARLHVEPEDGRSYELVRSAPAER